MGHAPTAQQIAVVNAIFSGESCVTVARAATGKTSVIAELTHQVARRAPGVRALYIVYNKRMAQEVAGRLAPGVDILTAHGLAMRHSGIPYQWRLNQAPDVKPYLLAPMLGFRKPGVDVVLPGGHVTTVKPSVCGRLARDTVRRFCYSTDTELGLKHVALPKGTPHSGNVEAKARILDGAMKLWRDAQDPHTNRFKYEHDYYLKRFGLSCVGHDLGYHLVIMDEGQDASPVMAQIILGQGGARRLVVGDPAQAIYGWRGAEDALSKMTNQGYPEYRLTRSFRFGPAIAELGNDWLAAGGHTPDMVGWDAIPSRLGRVDPNRPYAVLCRTNTGCVASLLDAIKSGQNSVGVVGGGIKAAAALVVDMLAMRAGKSTKHPSLDLFKDWDEMCKCLEGRVVSDPELVLAKRLVEDYGDDIAPILERAATIENPMVAISTAHGAKGLEFDQVRVSEDFTIDPDALKAAGRSEGGVAGPSVEDANLRYVAVTRARLVLDPGPLRYAW